MKCRDLPEFDLPDEDILGRVRKRIDAALVSSADKDFLLRRFHELASEVPRLLYPLAPAPTHGDAHVQNVMFCDSQSVLIDFERFAWGHPEWDISMTATEYQTAGWWSRRRVSKFRGSVRLRCHVVDGGLPCAPCSS